MLKLSINILSWNCKNTVLETLEILKSDLKDIEHEIIIVDNGSTDGGAEIAHIKNETNMGVSVGKNQALDVSTGEYVLMLDGDIVPVPNSINCLLDCMENNENIHALGFYPNKFTDQKNKNMQKHHEDYCEKITEPLVHTQAIAFYGMFRMEKLTENGIRFPEYGSFGEMGYGWEDSDFYMQMREAGIHQFVVGINKITGKYYHEINSSIRIMGHQEYIRTSKQRRIDFQERWGEKENLYYGNR